VRILFLSQYFFPEQFSNNNIVRELADRNHEVEVVTGVPNYPIGKFFSGYSNRLRREDIWHGVSIHRAWSIARGKSGLQLIANFICFPITGSWTALRRVRGSVDILFVSCLSPLFQALPAIVFSWIRRVPVVFWVQDIWPESALLTVGIKHSAVVKPLNWLCGWIYRRADLLLVQSDTFPAMIECHGVPRERIRVFPNTAPEFYRPVLPIEATQEGALVPQGGFRLMFAGNVGESQDFSNLIVAAEILRDRYPTLKWVIIGSGRALEAVKSEVARRDLEGVFYFLGRFPEERMPYFFAHADALLVSLKDKPIFALTVPYKIQTYLACGKPILACIAGEGGRIINEAQAGLVVPPSQPIELAKAIAIMINASPRRKIVWGRNARRYFEDKYESERIYTRLEQWLGEVANRT